MIVPSGPKLTAPSGALAAPVEIGMRPSATPPVVGPPGYTVLSSWYDVATSQLDTSVKSASSALSLDVPVAPPAAAIDHPGLQMLEVLNAYDTALDLALTGFDGNLTQTWAFYAADRGYVRTPDGWLWPTEPRGGGRWCPVRGRLQYVRGGQQRHDHQ